MNKWDEDIICKNVDRFELGNIWSIGNNLSLITNDFIKATISIQYDCIAGIETKGIILSSAVSAIVKKPLLIFRKKEKIAYTENKYQEKYINWKNKEDGIEIEKTLLIPNMKILIIDDIAQTLETFKAVYRITKQSESLISAFACIANISGKEEIDGIKILSLVEEEEI